jgi:hypothetical protein
MTQTNRSTKIDLPRPNPQVLYCIRKIEKWHFLYTPLIKISQSSCTMGMTNHSTYALLLAIDRELSNGQEYHHET